MKKIYRLEGLDCAHCAAKMEAAIRKVDGVEEATVNFLAQKLTLCAPEEQFEEVAAAVIRAAKKADPDCRIVG